MRRIRAFVRDCDQAFKRAGVSSVEPLSTTITSYGILSADTDFSMASRQALVNMERFRTGIMIEQNGDPMPSDCPAGAAEAARSAGCKRFPVGAEALGFANRIMAQSYNRRRRLPGGKKRLLSLRNPLKNLQPVDRSMRSRAASISAFSPCSRSSFREAS